MTPVANLPAKLDMMFKAMSLSRVAAARRLGVDKSLVGRWLSGAVHPTEHNLARLTRVVAESFPGFDLGEWSEEAPALAKRYGLHTPPATSAALAAEGPLAAFLASAGPELAYRGSAYEGFWRTSRPSLLVRDQVFHDYGFTRRAANGLIEVMMEGSGLEFTGWLFPVAGNVFVFLFDATGRTPMNLIFKGVSLPKAAVLDGILTLAALDPDRTPVAFPIVLERVGDLSGDEEADLAQYRKIIREMPEPVEPVPRAELEARLYRDCGHGVADQGGEPFLLVSGGRSLSRGTSASGLRG